MKRLILRPTFLLIGVLTVFAINLQAQDLNTARLLIRSEQYDSAAEMFQQLIDKDPSIGDYYFFLGENYLMDYFADTISNSMPVASKAAREIYQRGVDADPNNPLNYVGLAKVAHYLGDNETATAMRAKARSFLLPYKKIKKIVPPAEEYAYTLAKIAESYIKDNEVDTSLALPLIREAIKIDNMNRDVYLIAGDIYILDNDGSNAIMYYNQAQFADPESPTALMKIGNIYAKANALQVAISNFEDAIRLNAEYAPAYRELGQLYYRAGRYDQSKENFEKYLELTAGNIPAKIRYVNSLFYSKDYDEVIKNVEEIIAIDNSRSYMNRLAGYSYYEKENADYDKALSYMEELFRTVSPELILRKDHQYIAKILLKRNQDYPKMLDEYNNLKQQLAKTKTDDLANRVASLEEEIAKADIEIDRALGEYEKALSYTPDNRNLLNEVAISNYNYRRFVGAAKTWAKMIDPDKDDNVEDYIRVGQWYYRGERYNTADSVFNIVLGKSPYYLPAHLWIARTYYKMDPDSKKGLAKPKFDKVLSIAQADSVKNETDMMETFNYLSAYYMQKNDYNRAKNFFNRMISLNPDNNDNKIRGYNGLGSLEMVTAGKVQTNEGKLPYLSRAATAYNKTLAIDPSNAFAKSQLNYVRDFEALVRKGINPNEIKGVVRDSDGPVPFASVKIKDTAAEILTNARGEYKFEIPQSSEVLIFSAEGHSSKEVPITKSRTYDIVLDKE